MMQTAIGEDATILFFFIGKLKKHKLSVDIKYKYFDTGTLCQPQKIGTPYEIQESLFSIPKTFDKRYHTQKYCQQTIQLILEVI